MLPNIKRFITIYEGYERPFWVSQGLLAIATVFTLLIPLMVQSLIDQGLLQGDRRCPLVWGSKSDPGICHGRRNSRLYPIPFDPASAAGSAGGHCSPTDGCIILDERPTIQDVPHAPVMPPIQGHVQARDVDFSCVQGRPVLKHNTFEAKPGEKIGLCGPMGAGKSTIINLITQYYDLDRGKILIDGQNIATVQQDSLRQQIGLVLQEAFLFSDTVMNNLRYARLDATEKDCIEAAKQANAHDFILRLPHGYDTMLTERGSNLSQGQRQLLTIARMMVQNPRMVILDEAASNVDTRTSFVIAHRLSTIRKADRILVLKAGEIIEIGSHDELMQQRGFYYDLFMSQFKGKLASVA